LSSSLTITDRVVFSNPFSEDNQPLPEARSFTHQPVITSAFVSIAHRFPLGTYWHLVPELTGRYEFLSRVEQATWTATTVGLGVSLLYDLAPEPQAPPPDTTLPPPPLPKLEPAIAINGIDEQGNPSPEAVINVKEVILRKHTPLLPVVYFDSASAVMDQRYHRLSSEESAAFGYMNVARLGELELSHALLNLVGFRMREFGDVSLKLYGATSSDEPAALAAARVDTIRQYLLDTWGIAPDRIEIADGAGPMARSEENSSDGRSENRRVVLASDDPDLLAPIGTQRLTHEFNPPRIQLDPTFGAEAGTRSWSIIITQNLDTLARFSNRDASEARLAWRLNDELIDSTLGVLTATLEVEDSVGQVATARDQISLRVQRDSTVIEASRQVRGDVVRLVYSLVGFDYRSATADASHQLRLAELAELIEPGATVEVTGYTDRIGDDAYNEKLSHERARNIALDLARLLADRGISNISPQIIAGGVETGRFPNDLPEGRVLSRGAVITVEQRLAVQPR
jgi:outer membrane protein OmpA-like peptidoglycan-associated protein